MQIRTPPSWFGFGVGMTCGQCDCLGMKSVRYLPPEVLGMEPTRFDEDGESLPVKLVSYSCNYWDNIRHKGNKVSIATSVKFETTACSRFMPKVELSGQVLKSDWLEEMTLNQTNKLQERRRCLDEVTN